MNQEEQIVRRYVTRYALTKGIELREGKINDTGAFVYSISGDQWSRIWASAKEHHETMEQAVEAANSMRYEKISSLEKQIAKLKKLDFSKLS